MSAAAPDRHASLTIGNAIADLAKVVTFVDRFGVDRRISQAVINELNVCLDEVLNNTISYGYDDQGPHEITLTLRLTRDLLTVEIQDDGKPFDLTKADTSVPEGTLQTRKAGGVGIRFVKTLMDEMDYRRVGRLNMVTLKKRLNGAEADGNC
jgi:anti-sigma regulatory factor (Ser/Thr protein kinase)